MSEEDNGRKGKKLVITNLRTLRHRLAAVQWQGLLASITGIHFNGWIASDGNTYISNKEFAHRLAIGIVSAGIFGTGIGQLIADFRWG